MISTAIINEIIEELDWNTAHMARHMKYPAGAEGTAKLNNKLHGRQYKTLNEKELEIIGRYFAGAANLILAKLGLHNHVSSVELIDDTNPESNSLLALDGGEIASVFPPPGLTGEAREEWYRKNFKD